MLSIGDAHRLIDTHLGPTARAAHSILVGKLMRRLADVVGADPTLWDITGLCHDLDFAAVAGDWPRHGLLAADWLRDDLPGEALDAIRAHDHRTGVVSATGIAHALKLADALAVAHDQLGTHLALVLSATSGELASALHDRPHLPSMIVANSAALGIPLPSLATVVVSGTVSIAPITPDAPSFPELRQLCSAEGHHMLERFERHWRNGSNGFNAPGEIALGAMLDDHLVGLCARNRDPYDRYQRAGRVRHLYVAPAVRRLGIGRLLVAAIAEGAAQWFDYLNTNCSPEAAAFYEHLGFSPLAAPHMTHRLKLLTRDRS